MYATFILYSSWLTLIDVTRSRTQSSLVSFVCEDDKIVLQSYLEKRVCVVHCSVVLNICSLAMHIFCKVIFKICSIISVLCYFYFSLSHN